MHMLTAPSSFAIKLKTNGMIKDEFMLIARGAREPAGRLSERVFILA